MWSVASWPAYEGTAVLHAGDAIMIVHTRPTVGSPVSGEDTDWEGQESSRHMKLILPSMCFEKSSIF